MAKGRFGYYLEGWKLAVYVGIPIFASWYYSDPDRQKAAVNYWKYVQYPPNPNIGLKEQIQRMAAQKKQHEAYQEQLRALAQQASRTEQSLLESSSSSSSTTSAAGHDGEEAAKGGWWRWLGLGGKKEKDGN